MKFFEINQTAQVEALDATGNEVGGPVRANAAGEFAMAGLPNGSLELRATSEAAVVTQTVPASVLSFGGPVSPVTLTFSQSPPRIISLAVTEGQKAVGSVTPGATVTVAVNARGSNQNGLKFDWRLQKGMGSLNPAGSSAEWTLTANPGLYTAYVLVSDGFGGYASRGVSVRVGAGEGASASQAAVVGGASPASGVSTGKVSSTSTLDANPAAATTVCLNVVVASPFPAAETLIVTQPTGLEMAFPIPGGQIGTVPVSGLSPNTELKLGVLDPSGAPIPNVPAGTVPALLPCNRPVTSIIPWLQDHAARAMSRSETGSTGLHLRNSVALSRRF